MANFNLPVGADPNRDTPWGTDELGFPQFRTASGTIYSSRPQVVPPRQSQPGTMDRAIEVAKGYATDALQGLLGAATAPRRALEGGDGVTPADALNLAGLLQLGGAAAPKPRGALGANALRQVDEYGGGHRAPMRDVDFPRSSLDDPRDIFGGDDSIYSREALQYYGSQGGAIDAESLRAINTARSNPDAEVTVYRAIPKDLEGAQINAGDWVTPSRRYADLHGQGPLGGDYQIIKQKVRAGDLFTEGDIHEWGYDPLTTSANRDATTGAIALAAPRNEAEAMARQILEMRAQGRAKDVTEAMMAQADPQYMYANTPLPMDEASRIARAKQIGFDGDAYHATDAEFQQFIPSKVGRHGAGVYTGKNVADVQTFLPKDEVTRSYAEGSQVLPLRIPSDAEMASEMKWQDALPERWNYGDPKDVADAISGYAEGADALSRNGFKGVVQPATDWDGRVIFDPANIRSRFARFDPEFSHLANLNAANVSPEVGLLATQPTDADKEAILRYLGAQGLLR